jgi:hypothetical protein
VCGYNVRALTRPVCPECKQYLTLTVGVAGGRLGIGWLFAAVAPGFFSGICAIFVLIPIFGRLLFGDGVVMVMPIAMDVFGWCSGIFAIFLCNRRPRSRFLAMPAARQRWFAIIMWMIHIGALGLVIMIGVVFF